MRRWKQGQRSQRQVHTVACLTGAGDCEQAYLFLPLSADSCVRRQALAAAAVPLSLEGFDLTASLPLPLDLAFGLD